MTCLCLFKFRLKLDSEDICCTGTKNGQLAPHGKTDRELKLQMSHLSCNLK